MKKLTALISLFAVLLLLTACSDNTEQPKEKTISVNGEVIASEEIEYFKSRCKADIINDYAEEYGITDFSDFWGKNFDGKTPAKELEEKALEQAVEAKIKLVMMRENGIYEDVSFTALKAKAEQFNKEHENAKGTVGINSIDMSSFYTYYISTGEMELKTVLAENELKPNQSELEAAKADNPDLSENGLVDSIVSKKYDELIAEKIKSAVIE